MKIWNREFTLDQLNERSRNTLLETIDIKFIAAGDDTLTATMPVDKRTHQPYGLLHGGASVALAESLGSVASNLVLADEKKLAVGIEVNANHVRSVTEGTVTGVVKPLHLGRSLHVWEIKISDSQNRLLCISRLTVSVVERKS